jgi:hypothetical protein
MQPASHALHAGIPHEALLSMVYDYMTCMSGALAPAHVQVSQGVSPSAISQISKFQLGAWREGAAYRQTLELKIMVGMHY